MAEGTRPAHGGGVEQVVVLAEGEDRHFIEQFTLAREDK